MQSSRSRRKTTTLKSEAGSAYSIGLGRLANGNFHGASGKKNDMKVFADPYTAEHPCVNLLVMIAG
jgi:hypothetical protein